MLWLLIESFIICVIYDVFEFLSYGFFICGVGLGGYVIVFLKLSVMRECVYDVVCVCIGVFDVCVVDVELIL